jgi:WD40 repeat protein
MKRACSLWVGCLCAFLFSQAVAAAEILWMHGGHSWDILELKQSRDGKKLFSASADISVREWAMPEGRFVRTYLGHTNIIRAMDVSSDGGLVAAGADGGQVVVWDTADGAIKWQTIAHLYVGALAFSPDGKTLATGGGSSTDPTIKLWSAETGALLGTLQGHTSWVTSLAFKPDGKTLVSACVDRTIRMWDVDSQSQIDILSPGRGFIRVAFSPDASELTIASTNLIRYGVGNGWPALPRVGISLRNIMDVTYSNDGLMLATASTDRKVRWWRVDTGELLHEVTVDGQSTDPGQEAVLFSPDGQKIYSAGGNYTIIEWDVATGNLLRRVSTITGAASDIEFFNAGEKVAIVDEARVKVLKTDTGEILLDLVETNAASVAVLPAGNQMLTGGYGKIVELWDTATGAVVDKVPTFSSSTGMEELSVSGDGNRFVALRSGAVELWNVNPLQWVRTFNNSTGRIDRVLFLPDGGTVVTGDDAGLIRWWRASDGIETNRVQAHDWVVALALSPDGNSLASTGYALGEKLKIWDAKSGALQKEIAASSAFGKPSFSPDGRMIAAALYPGYVADYYLRGELRVWDLASGDIVMSHTNEAARIWNVNWSPNGIIVYGTGNGALVAVRAPTAQNEAPTITTSIGPNGMELRLQAPTGATVTVETSTNLHDWETWAQTSGTGAPEKFDVPLSAIGSARFFRARQP